MSDGSSDSEIVPEWTYVSDDESTFRGTAVWKKGKANGWKKDGVLEFDGRTFCAACFLETDTVGSHAEARKGERKGKRSKTCMEHEKDIVTDGEAAQKKLLETICKVTRPDFHKRVAMADPRYFVMPIAVSLFDRVNAKTKASTGD
jgi:hypothetical protein